MTTVFVYGTLKRGGGNHAFLGGQRFLGDARTAPGYTLYSLGDYPGMVRAPGDTAGVAGELWVVEHACWAELDRLESLDEGLYKRVDVTLASKPLAPFGGELPLPAAATWFWPPAGEPLAGGAENL